MKDHEHTNHTLKLKDRMKKFLQGEKPKKTIFSTVTFDNKLLSVRGEVQREPWKDLWLEASGWFYFCNKISLTIENKSNAPVNTRNCKQPIVLDFKVKGILNNVELLEKCAHNPELVMGVKDGNVILEHVQINHGEPLKLAFLAWFAVHVSDL